MADINPYLSKYSGENIDEGIEAALNARSTIGHVIIPTTPEKKVDLDSLLNPKVYRIAYYTNGYNDESTSRPIDLNVRYISDNIIEQSYYDGEQKVVRTYDVQDKAFGLWQVDSKEDGIIVSSINDTVEVGKQTLVLRYTE